jgi:hypothetical protein
MISVMTCGGFWHDKPRGYGDIQIERMITRGVNRDAARRYVRAVLFGGCTTAEALEIIRDRDCAHLGTAIELWDANDVPSDRWFRDAWSRSHNGGPISINLEKARPVQMRRIASAVAEENKRRLLELKSPVDFDLGRMRQRILLARDETELRQIWPL